MNSNLLDYKYKPFKFYSLALLITWAAWFNSAYFSFQENLTIYKYIFVFIGLLGPFAASMFLIFGSGNEALKNDFRPRLTDLTLINPD